MPFEGYQEEVNPQLGHDIGHSRGRREGTLDTVDTVDAVANHKDS